ncbi:hypothetical protein GCM10023115_05310 [Pontixanthobacter gangjinensis]|uniref:hypothetical protein n=1 Tax=Pontixanthobacter gangjinensis TaxID=1028742 RepID=UPI001928C09A|nr:hypothetical protein [Pontixanthobacter gangjinensis]
MEPRFPESRPRIGADPARQESNQLSRQWAAVQDAAAAVAMLAGLEPEQAAQNIRNFPALIKDAEGWRQELAKNHVGDIAAMMQPGLAALLATNARGQDATSPALTLWREYHAAREAVLGLLPEQGAMGPRRSA